MASLTVGDVVRLASGGPAMTVSDVLPWGEVFCIWFVDSGRCVGELFSSAVLRAVDPAATDPGPSPQLAAAASVRPALADGTPIFGYRAVPEVSLDSDFAAVRTRPTTDSAASAEAAPADDAEPDDTSRDRR